MAKKVPKHVLERAVAVFAEAGGNQQEAARRLNIPRATLQNRLWLAEQSGIEIPQQEEVVVAESSAQEVFEREKQRYLDQIKSLSARLYYANKALNDAEDLRSAIFELTQQNLDPPAWTLDLPKTIDSPGIPILFTSDFQWGEVIRASELDGINEFDRHVASRRYKLLIEKTIELAFTYTVRPKYDGLLYLRGGDMISGEIHPDLRESNDLQAAPAVKDLVEHECAGIESLLTKFNKIHIVSVPGNHGRMTPKPQGKGYTERNLDTLSAWWLESHWRKEKRVTFQTPASGDALLPVYGWRFLMTHGDRMGSRGGEGFLGAVATIMRGMKKTSDYYASLGVPLDLQFIGHYHECMELPLGFANGSLPGYSQYARDLRLRPQPPKQWLVFAHPKHMITARWPILLESRPRLA